MKLRWSIWLEVCLSIALTLGAVNTLSAATTESAGGDIPSAVRNTDDVTRKLDTPAVSQTDIQILELARAANEDVYSSLQSFVCDEQINRFRGSLNAQNARALDTITAKVSFESGVEEYKNVSQNNRQLPGLASLPGAWSEGEFGTLLLQTQQLLSTQQVAFDNFTDLNGEHAAVFHFEVSENDSPWDLTVAGHHYRLPFRTSVWVSTRTGEILKIDRVTSYIAPQTHISEIQWGITLDHVSMNGKPWLLPTNGTYSVLYNETRHREWNLISFSGYQRYGAQAAIKFE